MIPGFRAFPESAFCSMQKICKREKTSTDR